MCVRFMLVGIYGIRHAYEGYISSNICRLDNTSVRDIYRTWSKRTVRPKPCLNSTYSGLIELEGLSSPHIESYKMNTLSSSTNLSSKKFGDLVLLCRACQNKHLVLFIRNMGQWGHLDNFCEFRSHARSIAKLIQEK